MLKKQRERERKDWSRQPFPSPGDLPNPGIRPRSPALKADSLPSEPPGKPLEYVYIKTKQNEKLTSSLQACI